MPLMNHSFHILFAFAIFTHTSMVFSQVSGTPLDNTAAVFVHPGIAHSQSEIQFVREKLAAKSEPWKSDWERLRESQYAALKRKPSPQSHVERGVNNHPDIGSSELIGDGNAAYTHALIWALTDDAVHAKKAAEILNAWSHKLEQISNHDAKLLVGMIGHHYCNAAELLKHSRANWPKDDQVQFEAMLRNIFYPIIKDFYPSANGNWDASMLQTMIAMGIYLDDRAMFDRAVAYFRTGEGNGSIRNYFNAFGECQESGRDQAHTQMGLEFLANTCEAAWHQGIDLYSEENNKFLLGFEYTVKYNLGYDVPYEPFRSYQGRYHYESISKSARGKIRSMYEKVLNHYQNRKGLEAPFTAMAIEKSKAESRGTTLPWGTLMNNQRK